MILKIQTRPSGTPNGESYWLLDDLKKINKTGVFLKKDIPEEPDFDTALFSHATEEQYVELLCEGPNTEFCLVTDCVGYILNDSGKTIERILPRL